MGLIELSEKPGFWATTTQECEKPGFLTLAGDTCVLESLFRWGVDRVERKTWFLGYNEEFCLRNQVFDFKRGDMGFSLKRNRASNATRFSAALLNVNYMKFFVLHAFYGYLWDGHIFINRVLWGCIFIWGEIETLIWWWQWKHWYSSDGVHLNPRS